MPEPSPKLLNNIDIHVAADDTPKTICVIGAGVAGLATLKVILDTPQYKAGLWKPTTFELRNNVGGVWLPAPPTDNPPQTPQYDSLTANLPHPLLAYTSYSFPPSTPLYPHAPIAQKYLESYADHFHLRSHIRLKTAVDAVERDSNQWRVQLSTGEIFKFDFVIICNGHYGVPRYPDLPGVREWLDTGKATHSMWYRRPHYLGNTILVVGGGASGVDIAAEMQTVARTVILSATGSVNENLGKLKRRGRVSSFEKGGRVVFEDGSTESGIDHCILATGYQLTFSFLPKDIIHTAIPPLAPPLPRKLFNTTYGVFPLAKHLFPLQSSAPPSGLAFVGLAFGVTPWPLAEAQAHAVMRVFAHPEALNKTEEAVNIIARHEELRAKVGNDPLQIAKKWHNLQFEHFDYRDQLYEFAAHGLGSPTKGPIKVQPWVKEIWEKRDVLRKTWEDLVKSGKDKGWVEGVGEKGDYEWVDLMRKIVKWGEEHGVQVAEFEKSKL